MCPRVAVVTTSWDDGDPCDVKLATLLSSKGVRGTFYIPTIGYNGRKTVEPCDLKRIVALGSEVGAHGLSHHTLPKFKGKELQREVGIPKARLEDVLGEKVQMFSYPKGRFNRRVVRALKQAGYRGARGTRMFAYDLDFSCFEMPTTLQVYPHTRSTYIRNIVRGANVGRLVDYLISLRQVGNWVDLGKLLFDRVLRDGGVWHLVGHSWEIEELGLWNQLSEMLDYVARRKEVLYLTNGEVLSLAERKLER